MTFFFIAHVVHIVRICLVGDIRKHKYQLLREHVQVHGGVEEKDQPFERYVNWCTSHLHLISKTSLLKEPLVEAWLLMALDGC